MPGMDCYTNFAQVYDLFMTAPYERWVRFIEEIWKEYGLVQGDMSGKAKLILELACGTGQVCRLLAEKGYEVIGLDASEEMLMQARENSPKEILYLHQDMRDFELYGTVDSILCVCDGLNYLLKDKELIGVFKKVKNYLNPGGLFLFDLNTEYKFKHILGNNVFSEHDENAAMIWENHYHEKKKIHEYQIDFFIKSDCKESEDSYKSDLEDIIYRRYFERHLERAYSLEEISGFLETVGLRLLKVYEDYRRRKPRANSERLTFVATKN